ncbi:MAG TPA: GNAT family N-acetyltransferase, partial [Saprospiraceae bacterium]|nr:GNAT family N-acetyltransferase [Saprospiraceae bacterium]
VELAIQHRSTSLIFARTAEEIKSSVGAKAVNLTCYIRHRSSFTNRFIRPLLDYLNPVDDWVPRHPFKQED